MGGRIMRRGNFHRLLDIHGARLQRWPAAERQSAERLLAADAGARAARDAARLLQALLDRDAPPVDARIDGLAATLPPADGDKLRAALQARKDIGAGIDDLRAAQDKVRAILRAEPFDEAALRQAMTEVQARHRVVEMAIHDLIAGVAGQL